MEHPRHDEIVMTLENEGAFYREYMRKGLSYGKARNQITKQVGQSFRHDSGLVGKFTKEHAEAVRKYLDERWEIVRAGINEMETVKFKPETVFGSNPSGPSWVEHDFTNLERRVVANFGIQGEAAIDHVVDKMARNLLLYGTTNPEQWVIGLDTDNPQYFLTYQDYQRAMAMRPTEFVIRNQPQPQGTNMNSTITITTPTLINGLEISKYSDSQVYDLIAMQEAQIAKLEGIKNKPARLVAEIASLQAGIDALVAALNAKDKPADVPVQA